MSHQVLLQFGHHLLQDPIVVLLETHQFWETRDEEPWQVRTEVRTGSSGLISFLLLCLSCSYLQALIISVNRGVNIFQLNLTMAAAETETVNGLSSVFGHVQ